MSFTPLHYYELGKEMMQGFLIFFSVTLDTVNPGAKTIKKELRIKNITPEELKHNYTCTAKNTLGVVSRQALVKEKGA